MTNTDESKFPDAGDGQPVDVTGHPSLPATIARLVEGQLYGVLCTQGEGQAYGSLVAYAFTGDLRQAVFATPTATRKYRLLSLNDHVALLIDDRPDHPGKLMQVQAVTVTGRAHQVARGADYERYADLLTARHPQLGTFVRAESCALFRIDAVRFFHVTRFQEVGQWIPPAP